MAIFKGKDAYLPQLTQVYQVDTDSPEELDHLLRQYVDTEVYQAYQKAIEQLPEQEQQQKQRDFASACQLVRNTMATLYEKKAIDRWQRMGLDNFLRRFPAGYSIPEKEAKSGTWRDPDREAGLETWTDPNGEQNYLIPLDLIEESTCATYEDLPVFVIITDFRNLIRSLKKKEARLGRCPECASVFVEKRSGQTFCSDRCSNRARVKRHRGKKVNAEKKESALHAVI